LNFAFDTIEKGFFFAGIAPLLNPGGNGGARPTVPTGGAVIAG